MGIMNSNWSFVGIKTMATKPPPPKLSPEEIAELKAKTKAVALTPPNAITQKNIDKIDLSQYAKNHLEYSGPPPKAPDPNIIDNYESVHGKPRPENIYNDDGTIKTIDTQINYEYKTVGYYKDGTPIQKPVDPWNCGYNEYETDVDKLFFHTSTDFLMKAAQEYATIEDYQDFKYDIIKSDFSKSLRSFFGDDVSSSLHSEINAMVRELATKIKNGESTDLKDLKSTITIAGEQVSISKIKEIQEASLNFVNKIDLNGVGCGSLSLDELAQKGVVKGLAMAYGDSIGGKLGDAYKRAFARGIDANVKACVDMSDKYDDGTWNTKPTTLPIKYGKEAYEIFSKVSTKTSFDSAMREFDSLLKRYGKEWIGGISARDISDTKKWITDLYNSMK